MSEDIRKGPLSMRSSFLSNQIHTRSVGRFASIGSAFSLLAGFLILVGACASVQAGTEEEKAEADPFEELARFDERQSALIELKSIEARSVRGAEESQAAVREGKALVDELIRAYEEYIEGHPDDPRAPNALGLAHMDLTGDMRRAVELWQRTLKLDPDFADAHCNLGNHWTHVGRILEGIKHQERAVELAPEVALYHFHLGQSYFSFRPQLEADRKWDRQTLWEKMLKESKTARDLAPDDFQFAYDYASTFLVSSSFPAAVRPKEALNAWEHLRERFPEQSATIPNICSYAHVLMDLEEYGEAITVLEDGLKKFPGETRMQNLITRCRNRMPQESG